MSPFQLFQSDSPRTTPARGRSGSAFRGTFSPVLSAILGIALWCGSGLFPRPGTAQPPETAPPELMALIEEIEGAANRRDVGAVMENYARDFSNSDGLNYEMLEEALAEFWGEYSRLNYTTTLESWERDGGAIVATTVTQIEGVRELGDRQLTLLSTITSQQRIENDRIVGQEILSEQNQLTSGDDPPTVRLNLPERVQMGEEYSVDAIVEEPLGSEILIGTAIAQPATAQAYFDSEPLRLEFLPSGGVFKIGQAPDVPEDSWVSAILMRRGGITLVTRRLRVVD